MTAAVVSGIILLAFLGAPLFAVIGLSAALSFYSADIEPSALFIELYRVASAPTLTAIPLFTFAGFVLAHSDMPERLTRLSQAFLGRVRGGVAWMALGSCAFFTAFTGASGVTIIALGGLLYPLLLKENYSKNFSLGLLTSSGSIGILFPPSLPLILYGIVAKVSVDKLFLAGILPGILLILIVGIYSRARNPISLQNKEPFSLEKARSAIRESIWELPLPFLVLFGIYGGWLTLTESASLTCVYVVIVEMLVYKELSAKDLPKVIRDSMVLVGSIIIILGTAMGFTSYLVDEQVPMQMLEIISNYVDSPLTFLILLNLFLLLAGCTMDVFSAIVVIVPLIVPLAQNYGINLIHLGIIFLANLEIGYSTPPIGLNLFISSSRFEEPVVRLYKAALPFLGLQLIALAAITYFPHLSLFFVEWATPASTP